MLLDLQPQRETPARLLVIGSCRPVETIVSQHPARASQQGQLIRQQGYRPSEQEVLRTRGEVQRAATRSTKAATMSKASPVGAR